VFDRRAIHPSYPAAAAQLPVNKVSPVKEKGTPDILAGSGDDSDGGAGEDLSKIHINKEYVRRFERNKRPEGEALQQRLEEQGLLPASNDESSDVEEDAAIASCRVDRRVLSKDLIVGVHKKEGKEDKSSKESPSVEGPSSELDDDRPMNEQEGTTVKRKSTRSGRRKRRDGDLKMSTKRKLASGIINPKRPKTH
jgi:hypothetical protein